MDVGESSLCTLSRPFPFLLAPWTPVPLSARSWPATHGTGICGEPGVPGPRWPCGGRSRWVTRPGAAASENLRFLSFQSYSTFPSRKPVLFFPFGEKGDGFACKDL